MRKRRNAEMASGIKGACNRPKLSKRLRGAAKQKRHKPNSEKQMAYHAKIIGSAIFI
jgi:hypothetical protein